jgi:hypothetical protein
MRHWRTTPHENGWAFQKIPLANPSQRPICGRHRKQTEADLMEEHSSSFLPLQFTLNWMGILDSFSKLKRLLCVYIAGVLLIWLCLRFFEGSPAVSKVCQIHHSGRFPTPSRLIGTLSIIDPLNPMMSFSRAVSTAVLQKMKKLTF